MPAAIPAAGLVPVNQSNVGLVDERCRLEGLTGCFAGQTVRGEFAELVIDQGQELCGSGGLSLLDGREDLRYLRHRLPRWILLGRPPCVLFFHAGPRGREVRRTT